MGNCPTTKKKKSLVTKVYFLTVSIKKNTTANMEILDNMLQVPLRTKMFTNY